MGLAITHSIINKHDGHVVVQSKPGRGTTFTIYLPAATDRAEKTKTADNSLVRGSGRIMVMDDEEMLLNIAYQMLTHFGYDVVLVKGGAEAVAQYRKALKSDNAIDAVIMDLTIPGGMGGQEAVTEILAIDPHAKVIVSSGYSNDPVMANYQDYGFCTAIAKPFDLSELGRVINSILPQ